jgi:hypothetical protein
MLRHFSGLGRLAGWVVEYVSSTSFSAAVNAIKYVLSVFLYL